MSDIYIGEIPIGLQQPPFIIAELSCNHQQSLERALAITEAAAKAGVHAIKLQTYTADTLTLNVRTDDFIIQDKESLWHGAVLYDLYQKAYTPWEWHAPIMQRAKELGLICFSTPFDETAVDFLEELKVPAYKIASFENIHLPLIRKVASTGKPLIISTGMATLGEIEEAVSTARQAGAREIILLKCTSAYPANPTDAQVRTIPDLRRRFGCEVGLSDHSLGIGVAVAAVAQGGTVIEKHFTLQRADGSLDAAFSLETQEMQALVNETKRAWQALGEVHYGPLPAERPQLMERRSLYIAADMKAGEVFTKANVRCVRPAYGLLPKFYDQVLGKRVTRDVAKGTRLSWDLVATV